MKITRKDPNRNIQKQNRRYHFDDISSLDNLDLKDYGLENNRN